MFLARVEWLPLTASALTHALTHKCKISTRGTLSAILAQLYHVHDIVHDNIIVHATYC